MSELAENLGQNLGAQELRGKILSRRDLTPIACYRFVLASSVSLIFSASADVMAGWDFSHKCVFLTSTSQIRVFLKLKIPTLAARDAARMGHPATNFRGKESLLPIDRNRPSYARRTAEGGCPHMSIASYFNVTSFSTSSE
jgi:hypothetical protein